MQAFKLSAEGGWKRAKSYKKSDFTSGRRGEVVEERGRGRGSRIGEGEVMEKRGRRRDGRERKGKGEWVGGRGRGLWVRWQR